MTLREEPPPIARLKVESWTAQLPLANNMKAVPLFFLEEDSPYVLIVIQDDNSKTIDDAPVKMIQITDLPKTEPPLQQVLRGMAEDLLTTYINSLQQAIADKEDAAAQLNALNTIKNSPEGVTVGEGDL